ncbi:MAG: hypothetical protein KIH08_15785 [Candidatus Freyarchaeota archaeon]|nr:hypothetical protein [Candidatus Jordarchaeia archaeon]
MIEAVFVEWICTNPNCISFDKLHRVRLELKRRYIPTREYDWKLMKSIKKRKLTYYFSLSRLEGDPEIGRKHFLINSPNFLREEEKQKILDYFRRWVEGRDFELKVLRGEGA